MNFDYIKRMLFHREHTRWNTTDYDDTTTLLMSLMELEWRYHHLAMLYYRNKKHTKFHMYFGMYWSTKHIINVLFPFKQSCDVFSRKVCELDGLIAEEDAEYLRRCKA